MYFPAGFNKELSIELGELIVQAYNQFAAFEEEKPWHLPDKYHFICELSYAWRSGRVIENRFYNFDSTIRKTLHLKDQKNVMIPIGFIAQRSNHIFVVFRGTKTVKEWIHNLSINLTEYLLPNYGKIHEGFLEIYNSIRKIILENLSKIDDSNKVFVAGHSLGAALATLALPDIETTIPKNVAALYTFGSPRVGDDTFVRTFNRAFDKISFRIVNTSDIVTAIPLPIPLAGVVGGYFSHIDTPVDFTIQNNDIEENHDMKTYLSALDQAQVKTGFFQRLFRTGV